MNKQIIRFRKKLPLPHIDRKRLVAETRHLLHEGNVRHLIVKNRKGRTLVEVPLTVGVVGAALAPTWMAAGTVAILASECSISVERN